MTSMDQNLEQYFRELFAQRDGEVISVPSTDHLAIISLKIATWLLDGHGLAKNIAKELLLIMDVQERPDAEEELLNAIQEIEDDIEANLRGFCGFMEWIFQEVEIRRDPLAALDRVPNLDPRLKTLFVRMARALDAYLELEEAFLLSAPKASAVIFLVAFGDIYSHLMGVQKNRSHQVVQDWVRERIKKDAMGRLYEDSIDLIETSLPNEDSCLLTKDLIVVLLSFWAADWHKVRTDEIALVDKSLSAIGMLGIKPLLEAGFLKLDDSVRTDEMMFNRRAKVLQAT